MRNALVKLNPSMSVIVVEICLAESGDRKKARTRLRATAKQRTHHFNAFRTGSYVGLALPPLISGVYQCNLFLSSLSPHPNFPYLGFQPSTRAAIPAWGALLQIYAALFLPVVFSLLISLNLIAWSRARINYVFIFGTLFHVNYTRGDTCYIDRIASRRIGHSNS